MRRVYHKVHSVKSTNEFLQRWLEDRSIAEGTILSTAFQSRGRGQYGRSWSSKPKLNVLASSVFYPHFLSPNNQFSLNMIIATGLRNALAPYLPEVQVKWPNDIMVGHRKIAGILVQCAIQQNKLQHCVFGIGCNINQIEFPDFDPPAVSLKMIEGKSYDIRRLEQTIFEQIGFQYHRLSKGKIDEIRKEYNQFLWNKDRTQHFDIKGERRVSGLLLGLDEQGNMSLEINGRRKIIPGQYIKYAQ